MLRMVSGMAAQPIGVPSPKIVVKPKTVEKPKPKPPPLRKTEPRMPVKTKVETPVKTELKKPNAGESVGLAQAASDAAGASQTRRASTPERTALRGPAPRRGTVDAFVRVGATREEANRIVSPLTHRRALSTAMEGRRPSVRDSLRLSNLRRPFTGVVETKNTTLARSAGRLSTVTGGANAVISGRKALQAWRSGNRNQALTDGAGAVSSGANATKAAVETRKLSRNFQTARAHLTRQLANQNTLRNKTLVNRAVRRSATAVVNGRGERGVAKMLKPAMANPARANSIARRAVAIGARRPLAVQGPVAGKVLRPLRKAAAPVVGKVLRPLGKVAASPVGKVLVKNGAKVAAKAAGRFVPGLNVAIAAADAATAYQTFFDKKSSNGKKAAAIVTALGSAAAATNIPVVSQVGAGVSAVSSFVGGWLK